MTEPGGAPAGAPVAAYRIQQWTEGGFAGARARVPHLARLGVSHLYTSPVTEATPGSTHGYDGVDPTTVSAQLGGRQELDRLLDATERAGLAWLLDIVPNHLGVAVPAANPRWWSLLREGAGSPSARFFDVAWEAADGRVVLPVLGRPRAEVLADGEITVDRLDDHPVVSAAGFTVPIRPDDPTIDRPPGGSRGPTDRGVDGGDSAGTASSGTSRGELEALLARQHHQLDWWRAGTRNYRVFFDVNELAGVRVEDPVVFEEMHRLPAAWIDSGRLHGLRVDHVDGLVDPDGYLENLRKLVGPDCWLLVEKIVIGDETVPGRWPVDGTTGYEAACWITRLLVDPDRETDHTARFEARTGPLPPWHHTEQKGKDEALTTRMAVDVRRLAAAMAPPTGGPDDAVLTAAVAAVTASLPVYRTYLPSGGAADRDRVEAAVDDAARRHPDLADRIAEVGRALLGSDTATTTSRRDDELLLRWQQLTGPAMAKGVEDTALYRHRRLSALNDVGTDPAAFGTSTGSFHRAMAERLATCGCGLTTTTTHDTKRSADVRARLAVLPGVGPAWDDLLDRWWPALTTGPDALPPLTAHLLLETAVGAWPLDTGRLEGFLIKAEREAGSETSWREPSPRFEGAVTATVARLLSDRAFVADVDRFVDHELLEPGRVNALTQVLLRCTVPGVPDVYQGDEIWNLRLVDPDNRSPVDWDRVEAVVGRVLDADLPAADTLARYDEGDPKALVLVRALALRRRRPLALGPEGSYRPLATSGVDNERLLAFARGDEVVVVVPRFPERGPIDASVELPAGPWSDVLRPGGTITAGPVSAADLLASFPVALLERAS